MDWITVALLIGGLGAVFAGLLPSHAAGSVLRRIAPLLVFLATVIPLAELTANAEVFDVVAGRIATAARGSFPALFGLCVVFATVTTATLNLDTTAVLLTPVMLATGATIGMRGPALAMTTVWLANTASLLLPVSNLTNLLAANRVALSAPRFAHQMVLPEVLSVAATAVCLWVFYWRRGRRDLDRYEPPSRRVPADRVLFTVASGACLLFVAFVVADVPLQIATPICAFVLVLAYARRRPAALRFGLLPVRLLCFVTGLFLVIETVSRHGLATLVRHLVGGDGGTADVFRASATGAGLANLVNNLPSYLAGEAAVANDHHLQLLGLLIGTNVGPVVTPWASLATLLWYERCTAAGVAIAWRRFVLTGLVTACFAVAAATSGLVLTGAV
jgi:arsenical pump membrane protein